MVEAFSVWREGGVEVLQCCSCAGGDMQRWKGMQICTDCGSGGSDGHGDADVIADVMTTWDWLYEVDPHRVE